MASPHVAGVMALMKSVNASLTPSQIDQLLAQGDLTDDLGVVGRDNLYGYGLINAQKAVAAAIGNPPAGNPNLGVTPGALNFDAATSQIEITFQNTGGGALQISSIDSSENWAQIAPVNADGNGLGIYAVTINRAGLADGAYSATLTIVSDVNTVSVPVIMTVGSVAAAGDVGHVYVLLLDANDLVNIAEVEVDVSGGIYQYLLSDVPAGDYEILAGTDIDNDFFICDLGEACGLYTTIDTPTIIHVDGDLGNLDFPIGYQAGPAILSAGQNSGSSAPVRMQRKSVGKESAR